MINGIIYKLFCKDYDDFYIGSTIDFHHRKRCHKTDCNNKNRKSYNYKLYKFIREHNGFDSWEFEILELGEYENKYLLHDRERYFIETLKPSLNSAIPNRTDKDWYEDNKEYKKEKAKVYYQNNKNKISEYGKDKILCDICNCNVRRNGLARHKKSQKHINNLNKIT